MKSFLAYFVGIVFSMTLAIGMVLEGIAIYVAEKKEPVMIMIDQSPKLDLSALTSRSVPGVIPGCGLYLDATTAAVAGTFFLLVSAILAGLLLVAAEISKLTAGPPDRRPLGDRLMAWLADPPVEKTRGALPEAPAERPRGQ